MTVSGVDKYEVHWVDNDGRSIMKMDKAAATVTANKHSNATCCNKKMLPYRAALKGTWPNHTGPIRLAITAVSKSKATLPFFSFSAPVMNSMHGKVQKVTGDFTLKMSKNDAEKLAKDPKAKTALANALATSVGLPADDIIIT